MFRLGLELPSAATWGRIVSNETSKTELFFCLCGAAGTALKEASEALAESVQARGYNPVHIRISELMRALEPFKHIAEIKDDEARRIRESMDAGNRLRRAAEASEAALWLALGVIQDARKRYHENSQPEAPAYGNCYIIHSIKRREEIEFMRRMFSGSVFLVSVFETEENRVINICKRIAKSRKAANEREFESEAQQIIEIDRNERDDDYGQRLEEAYSEADVFLKIGRDIKSDADRFVKLIFGSRFETPSAAEYFMFHAQATARRSADLSRQVGAVIVKDNDIVSVGYNEVPKAGGGVYWGDCKPEEDFRDYKESKDSSAVTKIELVEDVIEALKRSLWLSPKLIEKDTHELAMDALFNGDRPLAKRSIASILEFGRIVHAEMAAITTAARRGLSIDGATIYCTTFPCHMCARHIISSGVSRLVYIEPYPKSRAKSLYERAICVDGDRRADKGAVAFDSFIGIAPRRYLELFEMVERKDKFGFSHSENGYASYPLRVTSPSLFSDLDDDKVGRLKDVEEKILSEDEIEGESDGLQVAERAD